MKQLDPNRTMYPSAPLNLVICAIEFSPVPKFNTQNGFDEIYEKVKDHFPIIGEAPNLTFSLGPSGPQHLTEGARFLDRDRTRSLAVVPTYVSFETSSYTRFEDFLDLTRMLLVSLDEVASIPSLQRVGLRYIDEISVDGADGLPSWKGFVADDLLAPAEFFSGFKPGEYRAATEFELNDGHSLTMRFGVTSERAVNDQGPLRIKNPPQGKYFLLDLDSTWAAPEGQHPEFDIDEVINILYESHAPIREIFENSITDELKKILLRERS